MYAKTLWRPHQGCLLTSTYCTCVLYTYSMHDTHACTHQTYCSYITLNSIVSFRLSNRGIIFRPTDNFSESIKSQYLNPNMTSNIHIPPIKIRHQLHACCHKTWTLWWTHMIDLFGLYIHNITIYIVLHLNNNIMLSPGWQLSQKRL